MIKINDKANCTGCSACASICPQSCITMIEDAEGFDYPIMDFNNCIDCHLCERVCPLRQEQRLWSGTYTVCVQNDNEMVRRQSSAGGVIGAIYNAIFEQEGIVFGAGFDQNNIVHFMSAENMGECFHRKLFASKYVAAELDGVFPKVKIELEKGRLVCFAGLPCQVAGLKAFLRKDYEKLWLVDLTCYGVPSRKLYRKYITYLEDRYHQRIASVRFRDKIFGYAAPTMSVELSSGKVKSQNCAVKSYLRGFFKNLISRPACYQCQFKTVDRVSDMTVGDMNSIYMFIPTMDDDLGTTVVYIHSEKGQMILNKIKDSIKMADVPLEGVLNTSGMKMISCPGENPLRSAFFSEIDSLSYEKLIKKYCPPDKSEFIANIVKGGIKAVGLNKSGLMRIIKRR